MTPPSSAWGKGKGAEIAFGGSFTAIRPAYRRELLEATHPLHKGGRLWRRSRISTGRTPFQGREFLRNCDIWRNRRRAGRSEHGGPVLALNRQGHSAEDRPGVRHDSGSGLFFFLWACK